MRTLIVFRLVDREQGSSQGSGRVSVLVSDAVRIRPRLWPLADAHCHRPVLDGVKNEDVVGRMQAIPLSDLVAFAA